MSKLKYFLIYDTYSFYLYKTCLDMYKTYNKYITIFNYFALSATILHVVWYIFIEIDKTLIENCKMVQALTWKIPH